MRRTLTGVVLDESGTVASHLTQRIRLARGEHAELSLRVLKQSGDPFPLAGFTVVLIVPDLAIVRGGLVTDPIAALATVELAGDDTSAKDSGEYPYYMFIHEGATSKPYCIIPASPLQLGEERYDGAAPITTVGAAQQLVGMPTPTPSYNVRPYFFGGVWRLPQFERAKASFAGTAQASVSWPSFATRPFEVRAGAPKITDAEGPVVVDIESVTPTGCLVQLSDAITGEVNLEIEEVLS
jgi:hypothetical protein